ncbi:MAG: hypothetical protein WCP92_02730 [bacterium]
MDTNLWFLKIFTLICSLLVLLMKTNNAMIVPTTIHVTVSTKTEITMVMMII